MIDDDRIPACTGQIHEHTHFIDDGFRVPVKHIQHALHIETPDGILNIGGHDFYVQMSSVNIYTSAWSHDPRSTAQIMIETNGDGLAQHVLDQENWEASKHPDGPKEYWRAKQVGVYTTKGGDPDAEPRLMTDEDFENEWGE